MNETTPVTAPRLWLVSHVGDLRAAKVAQIAGSLAAVVIGRGCWASRTTDAHSSCR